MPPKRTVSPVGSQRGAGRSSSGRGAGTELGRWCGHDGAAADCWPAQGRGVGSTASTASVATSRRLRILERHRTEAARLRRHGPIGILGQQDRAQTEEDGRDLGERRRQVLARERGEHRERDAGEERGNAGSDPERREHGEPDQADERRVLPRYRGAGRWWPAARRRSRQRTPPARRPAPSSAGRSRRAPGPRSGSTAPRRGPVRWWIAAR